jgi:hypothetical protein
MDVGELGWSARDWIDLARNKEHWKVIVEKAGKLQLAENVGKFLSS